MGQVSAHRFIPQVTEFKVSTNLILKPISFFPLEFVPLSLEHGYCNCVLAPQFLWTARGHSKFLII